MIIPRNSLVLVRLIEQTERQIGNIIVPLNSEQFCEAEVIAVGPGTVAAQGGISETADLRPGQRVWVKHKTKANGPLGPQTVLAGMAYQQGNVTYHVFEQTQVIGIIAKPVGTCFAGPGRAN